jgi:thiol-disulfide isomerase/thioredoxin
MILTAANLDGKPLEPRQLQNKVVLVVFWGTWCIHCKTEFPKLIRLYEKYQPHGFEIIGYNTAVGGDVRSEVVRNFLDKTEFDGKKIPWINLYENTLLEDSSTCKLYGIENPPIMVLIGRDGKVAKLNPHRGMLEQHIVRALDPGMSRDDLTDEEKIRYDAVRQETSGNP